MHLTCKSCNAPIQADDIHLEKGLAKCRACHAVFRFEVEPDPVRLSGDPARPARGNAPRPEGIEEDAFGNQLTFRYRWYGPKYLFLLFFCIVWDGFLVFWYGATAMADAPLIFKLFPLIHVAVGVGLTYTTIAGFLNTTVVQLDRGSLTVRHGPLPWPGNLELSTTDVRQLYTEEQVHRTKNGTRHTYRLNAVLATGQKKKLVSDLDEPDLPLYLEQRVEGWLRLKDEPVSGELRRY